jgi:prepilin-type N-terminal cleavage/methylation domain-containing protein/prepilin-type processing-associated H-X9-DG protein
MADGRVFTDRRGFTLIELLVVISVIALLIAVLMPALAASREISRRAVCLSNSRQLSVASQLMAEDNKGWINGINAPLDSPDAGYPLGSPNIHLLSNYWAVKVNHYLATPTEGPNGYNALVMLRGCPDAQATSAPGYGSFGANSQFVGWGYPPMHTLLEVKHTSRIILIAEYQAWFWNTPSHLDNANYGNGGTAPAPRHGAEGMNLSYVDGHAGFMRTPDPTFGPWWDTYPGVGEWFPNAWPFGMIKE